MTKGEVDKSSRADQKILSAWAVDFERLQRVVGQVGLRGVLVQAVELERQVPGRFGGAEPTRGEQHDADGEKKFPAVNPAPVRTFVPLNVAAVISGVVRLEPVKVPDEHTGFTRVGVTTNADRRVFCVKVCTDVVYATSVDTSGSLKFS